MNTVGGHYVGLSELGPIDGKSWGCDRILIGMIWTSKRLNVFLGQGIWNADTGEFIYFAKKDKSDSKFDLKIINH